LEQGCGDADYSIAEASEKGSQMEIVIIVLLFAAVIWIVTKIWHREKDFEEASLAKAWRTVLSDPNYKKRRSLEERKYAVEDQAQTLGEAARETSQS
jgi:hypothetical protein